MSTPSAPRDGVRSTTAGRAAKGQRAAAPLSSIQSCPLPSLSLSSSLPSGFLRSPSYSEKGGDYPYFLPIPRDLALPAISHGCTCSQNTGDHPALGYQGPWHRC